MPSEIENAAQKIEQECENFEKIYRGLMEKGEKLRIKFKDRLEKIGNDLKEIFAKSKAIVEAWRLIETEFKDGRIERDSYERRFRELTEDIIKLKFDLRIRVCLELESFDRKFNASLRKRGVPSTLPPVGTELKLEISEEDKEKVEAFARSMDETRDKLGEVGVKGTFGNPETYIRLGVFYCKASNPEKGKEYFERALEIDPDLKEAWNSLGNAIGALGDYKQAIKHFERALEIDPEYASAWANLGWVHGELGDHKKAMEYSKRAVKLDPNDEAAWNNLGHANGELGNQKEAKRCFKMVKQLKKM